MAKRLIKRLRCMVRGHGTLYGFSHGWPDLYCKRCHKKVGTR